MAVVGGGGHLQIKMCYFYKQTKKKTTGKIVNREFHINLSVATLLTTLTFRGVKKFTNAFQNSDPQ